MSKLVVLAPLRSETAALRLGGVRATRAGMGAKVRAFDGDVVVVAGVCGAVDPSLMAGDVVVATELRDKSQAVHVLRDAETLASGLRRRGLRVVTGPIYTADRVLDAAARDALAADGVVAVDMESSLLAPLDDRPFAVVRVVVDVAGRGLVHPATLVAGPKSLLALRRTGPAIAEWASEQRSIRLNLLEEVM